MQSKNSMLLSKCMSRLYFWCDEVSRDCADTISIPFRHDWDWNSLCRCAYVTLVTQTETTMKWYVKRFRGGNTAGLSYRGCRPCTPDRTPTGRKGPPTSWWAPPGPAQRSCSLLFLSAFQLERTTARAARCCRGFHQNYSLLIGRENPSVALSQREGTRREDACGGVRTLWLRWRRHGELRLMKDEGGGRDDRVGLRRGV